MARRKKLQHSPLPIQFRNDDAVVTASAGVVLLLDLLAAKRLLPCPDPLLDTRQGWTDGQMMLTLMLLNSLGLDGAKRSVSAGMHRRPSPHRENWAA